MEKDTLFLIINGGASAPRGILAAEALRDAAERLGRKLEIEVRANGATLIAFDTPPGPDDRILLIGGKAGEKDSSVPERAETIPVVDIGSILTNPTGALELLSGGAVTPGAPAGGTKKELIVAITSCPTGIAHTFMAAEGLEQAAKALGYDIRVETQGSVGAGTPLTPEEISRAALVLIAADKEVERSRFVGKRVFATATKPAITAGEALIRQAFSEATTQAGDTQKASSEAAASQKRAGPYKHLMTGVSFMLPFVVAGGLLIALGFAFGGIYAGDKSNAGTLAHALFTIGATGAFTLIVPVLAGYIAYSIADRPGIAPGMVGGVLAANLNAGFLGGIAAGFIAGYVTDLLNRAIRLPKNLAGLKPVLILPLLGTLITGLLMQYAVGAPVARALQALTDWLQGMQGASSVLLGLLLGGMMAIDMGGPIRAHHLGNLRPDGCGHGRWDDAASGPGARLPSLQKPLYPGGAGGRKCRGRPWARLRDGGGHPLRGSGPAAGHPGARRGVRPGRGNLHAGRGGAEGSSRRGLCPDHTGCSHPSFGLPHCPGLGHHCQHAVAGRAQETPERSLTKM